MIITPEIEELYSRFLRNEATSAEVTQLLACFDQLNEQDLRLLISKGIENPSANQISTINAANILAKLNRKIDSNATLKVKVPAKFIARSNKSILLKIAASIIFVFGLGALAYLFFYKTNDTPIDVKPGGNYATLNLARGSSIDLQTVVPGLVTSNGSTRIYKKANGEIVYLSYAKDSLSSRLNTLFTPKGGQYKVTLSDGSTVTLNSGSSLKFPNGFYGDERVVTLTGEAYFEVAKNPLKPFIVHCGEITTRVLGTKFNISAYREDGKIKATLLSGKIRVSQNNMRNTTVLLPGQQATIGNNSIAVAAVDAEDYTEWHNGTFLFNDEDLSSVMRHLARWYNIDVDYSSLPDRKLYVRISKNVNLSDVLRMISITSNLKFQFKEGRLAVIN